MSNPVASTIVVIRGAAVTAGFSLYAKEYKEKKKKKSQWILKQGKIFTLVHSLLAFWKEREREKSRT